MKNKIICLCNLVTEKEIKHLLGKGASSISEIQTLTKAGTTCGRCLPEIEAIVENYLYSVPADAQSKIKFD